MGSGSCVVEGLSLSGLRFASEAVAEAGNDLGCCFKTKREKAKIPPPRRRAMIKSNIKVGR